MTTMESSIRKQLQALALAFWSPGEAIDQAASLRSPWLIQAFLIGAQVVMAALAYRFVAEVRIDLLPANIRREAFEASVHSFRMLGWMMGIITVVRAFLWWYLTAGVLTILNILISSREQPFFRLLSLSVHTSLYSIFAEAHLLLVWYARGTGSFRSAKEMMVPLGLNLLPLTFSSYWYSFMSHINPYELATTIATAFGFVRLTGSAPVVSYVSILAVWLAATAIRSYF